jgi:biopolymer transport protein ExbB/TolQ
VEVGDLVGKVPLWLAVLLIAWPVFWPVVTRWLDGRRDQTKERAKQLEEEARQRAELIRLAQEVAKDAIQSLQDRVDALEAEMSEMRREHAHSIAAKDAEIALLRGEVRQWQAIADTYERQLTEAGIPHEQPTQPIWRVPAGDAPTDLRAT